MVKAFIEALPVLLYITLVFSSSTSSSLPSAAVNSSEIQGLKFEQLLQSSVAEQLHLRVERKTRDTRNAALYRDQSDVWMLEGFRNLRGCPRASRQFKVFTHSQNHYAIVATNAAENNTELYIFNEERGCGQLLATLPTRAAYDFELIYTIEAIRIVVLEQNPLIQPHKRTGSSVYTLTFQEWPTVSVSRGEVVRSERPSCITSWKQHGIPHVAICNSMVVDSDGVVSYSTQSYIYCASGGYLDQCGEIDTHFPQAMKHFHISNRHYLAVANHPNNIEPQDVPTEILRYDPKISAYKHWQYLPTKAAKDICYFTLGSGHFTEHYLAIVNQFAFGELVKANRSTSSHIYKFSGEKFEPFQALAVHTATGCVAYQANDGRFALIFSSLSGSIVYQYNGWRFVSTVEYSQHSMGPGVRHLSTVALKDNIYISVANDNSETAGADNLFLPQFTHSPDKSLTTIFKKSLSQCQEIRDTLTADPIGVIVDLYDQAVKKNDTNINLGRVSFNRLSAKRVLTNEVQNEANATRLGALQITQIQDLMDEIDSLSNHLNSATKLSQQAIQIGGNFIVNGPVRVHTLVSNCITEDCNVKKINASKINSMEPSLIFKDAVLLSDKFIPSTVRFANLVADHIEAANLSDRLVGDYLQSNTDLIFDGKFIVDGDLKILGNVQVDGLVDNRVISNSNLLLRYGDQQLNWTLQTKQFQTGKMEARLVNGQEISNLYLNALSRTSNVSLLQPRFLSGVEADQVFLSGLVNGVDLKELNNSAMKLKGDQVVTGFHVYESAQLKGVEMKGLLNEHQFPDDFIPIREGDHLRVSKLQLTHDVFFANLQVSQDISGIPVMEDGALGAKLFNKTLNISRVVSGRKTFQSISSGQNVTSNTFNGKTMDQFNTSASLYGSPDLKLNYDSLEMQGNVVFQKQIFAFAIDGIDLNRLEESSIPLDTEIFPLFNSITFTSNITVDGDLTTGTLDSIPTSGFIPKDFKDFIIIEKNCKKTFTQELILRENLTIIDTLNDYDLSVLWEEALKIEGDQTLNGFFLIENDVDIFRLESADAELVPLSEPGSLTGRKEFLDLTIKGDWFVDELEVGGRINDVAINSWANDTIMKNKPDQVILARKSIDKLTVGYALVKEVDGVDIDNLLDAVIANEPATIHSDLIINGPVFSKIMNVNGTIDGVDSDAPITWLRYLANQTILGSLNVNGSLKADQFEQDSWTINSIDLAELLSRAVRIDQQANFTLLVIDELVIDELVLSGTIQGINITEDLVLKSSDQQQLVGGLKSFTGPLISESLHVSNELNGQNPIQLCQTNLPPQSLKWIVYGNVTVSENATLNVSSLNHMDVKELLKSIWLKGSNVDLPHKQTFKDVIINGTLTEGLISNVNLTDLSKRAVQLASGSVQLITGLHSFESLEVRDTLKIRNFNGPSINGVRIANLTDSVLLRNSGQNISNQIIFQDIIASNIAVDGLVNNLDLNSTLMRNDRPNAVSGRKFLSSIVVKDSVDVCDTCLVDSVDLSSWADKIVRRTGNYTLSKIPPFESMNLQQPITLNGTLNGIVVDKTHLMTLSDPQVISGPLTLSSLLPESIPYSSRTGAVYQEATEHFKLASRFDQLNVKGLYDGVNLTLFYSQSVRRNVNVTFEWPVVLSSLDAHELLDTAVNSTLRDIIHPPSSAAHHVAASLPIDNVEAVGKHQTLNESMNCISEVLSHQTLELKFFKEVSLPAMRMPTSVDACFAWPNARGGIEMSFYDDVRSEFFYGSSSVPLLKQVEINGVAASSPFKGDFAVSALDRSGNRKHESFIISSSEKMQIIPTEYPMGCVYFSFGKKSCYMFVERATKSPIYCRPSDSKRPYNVTQHLPTVDARLAAVGYNNKTNSPLLAIASEAQRGLGRIVVWNFNPESDRFEPWKTLVTLQIIAMDCICDQAQCLLATVAPSKPAAIPGQVIIWSLNGDAQPVRLQRLAFSEPLDVKFVQLPDGRLALMVLQCNGVDNVMVYIWRGLLQFQHVTTIKVPGAQDLSTIATDGRLLLALTVSTSAPDISYGPIRIFQAQFVGQLE